MISLVFVECVLVPRTRVDTPDRYLALAGKPVGIDDIASALLILDWLAREKGEC